MLHRAQKPTEKTISHPESTTLVGHAVLGCALMPGHRINPFVQRHSQSRGCAGVRSFSEAFADALQERGSGILGPPKVGGEEIQSRVAKRTPLGPRATRSRMGIKSGGERVRIERV